MFVDPVVAANAVDFFAAVPYELPGSSPTDVVARDVNGDGHLDLVAAMSGVSGGDGKLAILVGDGAGAFQNDDIPTAIFNPRGVEAADLNNDGLVDIVATASGQFSSDLYVYLGVPLGGYAAPFIVGSSGNDPADVVAGDFNQDGVPDLAVANAGSPGPGLSILLGNGDGSFRAGPGVTGSDFLSSGDIAVGHLNADTALDVATTAAAFVNAGDGGFSRSALLGGVAVAVGDLNRDGRVDIVRAGGSQVLSLLGNGDATFSFGASATAGSGISSAALDDMNLDGILDVVVVSADTDQVGVLLGVGDGSFMSAQFFATGAEPQPLALGDWDEDGHVDIAVPYWGAGRDAAFVSILLQRATGPPPEPGTLQFSVDQVLIPEQAGSLQLMVNRVGGSVGAVSVDFETRPLTAADGSDYTGMFGTLNFAAGVTVALIDIPITDDLNFEPDEDFLVNLLAPSGGAALGIPSSAHVTIVDNDPMPANTPPVANAGADQSVPVGTTVQFDGTASSDVDGDALSFSWVLLSRPAGSTAVLSAPTLALPTLLVDVPGTYVAQLIVNDGSLDSLPDSVSITTVNSAPVANAGADQTSFVGNLLTLDGSASSDVDGDPLTFNWLLASRPAGSLAALSATTTVMPTFTPDVPGSYVAQLVVNDGLLNSAPDMVMVSTVNSPPVANAGADQSLFVGDLAQLDGSASSDVDGDPLSFGWSLLSVPAGSAAGLSDPGAAQPTLLIDAPGSYVVQLVVSDGVAASAPDMVVISTLNSVPAANAGTDQTVLPGALVQLDGSASSDADKDPLQFSWSLSVQPATSAATLSDPMAVAPSFIADVPGMYIAQLMVNDGTAASPPDTVVIQALSDGDGDGVADTADNCTAVPNPLQTDTDGDGFGNACDGDLNNDGSTNTLDLQLYANVHRTVQGDPAYDPDADFDANGAINTLDLNIYRQLHRTPPGPSCCAG